MAPNPYQKFFTHATRHLKTGRPAWTTEERRNTIVALYHGDPSIKLHYASNRAEIPALTTLFPIAPYSKAEADVAREQNVLPAPVLPPAPVPPPAPPAVDDGPDLSALDGEAPAALAPFTPAAAPPVPAPVALAPTGTPYEFWPPLPWPYEPDLPDVETGAISRRRQNTFLETEPHLSDEETNWHGVQYLGSGSYGAAGLWCEVDSRGNVIDRMVVKDIAAAPRAWWRDPKYWRDRLPKEIAIHRRIESRREIEPDACRNIIRYRGHRMLMSKRRYRLYTDYASGGDLLNAMHLSYHSTWSGIDPENIHSEECLPEAFVWAAIKALATACVVLQNGTVGDGTVDEWRPIMHLDFQFPNILLGVQDKKRKAPADEGLDPSAPSSSKRFKSREYGATTKATHGSGTDSEDVLPDVYVPRYKDKDIVPMLADFGLSTFDLDFSHCPDLDENPTDHILTAKAHDFRYAPEHHFQSASEVQTLDEKTNVWGIGRIAWGLIVNQWEQHGPMREDGPMDDMTGDQIPLSKWDDANMASNDMYHSQVLIGSSDWPAAQRYSVELRDLVRDCLRFWKDYRPSPREVLDRVNRHLDANPHLKADPMDVTRSGLVLPNDYGFVVGHPFVDRPR